MSIAPNRARFLCFVLLIAVGTPIAHAERQRSPGILRGLIGELVPGSAREIEEQALREKDGTEALRLYGSLQSRFANEPEGVRAAIWVGLYYYGAGEEEAALEYFDRARKNARSPDLRARAEFWCDQVRLRTGGEPLPVEEIQGNGPFQTLQKLARVDRSVRDGRRGEAETGLLSIEGDARRAGLLGPCMARWGDVLRMPGTGRVNREVLDPLLAACAGFPERLRVAASTLPAAPSTTAVWALQFGAFLDPGNAERQVEELRRQGVELRIDEMAEDGRPLFRTRLGEFATRAAAESTSAQLGLPAGTPCQIVRVR